MPSRFYEMAVALNFLVNVIAKVRDPQENSLIPPPSFPCHLPLPSSGDVGTVVTPGWHFLISDTWVMKSCLLHQRHQQVAVELLHMRKIKTTNLGSTDGCESALAFL